MWCDLQVLDKAHFLPQIGSGEEIRIQYSRLCQALDEYIHRTFYEFTLTVPKVHFFGCFWLFLCSVIVGVTAIVISVHIYNSFTEIV